ncbi:Gfo/Idh/MocA family oxidoreductase [Streptomyces sp. SID10853]|uniref:Gfo/Idh/MocA family oxidoreductase n=1 Tax=Streptomyces sp. SID10853 TaxID=2706028 RepID=UPI0013BF1F91|nr:Gfo/Idh/MocA family oxidoreductase [Streptomyces sp. SID10853]NDZ81087.1 Gfo/Idh/MocA family oxidoreductase [Streptomyces sp. SID10853]
MLRTLIVGLGRAGLGLHLPVLLRARSAAEAAGEGPVGHPIVGVDPGNSPPAGPPDGLLMAGSLRRARELLDPEHTVVHLCTPPAVRADVLREAAGLGFSRIILEKPLAGDREALQHVLDLARDHELRLSVVAPWLHSTLTRRLIDVVANGRLGAVRSAYVTQHKARFRRSLGNTSHSSAFDVEVPHATGVLLRLLGDARVSGAACTDLRVGQVTVPRMGSARLRLLHTGGARSEVLSDLSSPVRRRRIELDMAGGRVVGDYAVAQDDDFAQLEITQGGRTVREVFHDDSLTAYMTHAYRHFADEAHEGGAHRDDVGLHVRTVELLDEAKRLAADDRGTAPAPPGGQPSRYKEAVNHGS